MGKETKRSAEMGRVLEKYAASGLGRREFCEQRGMALTTFDDWRREHADKRRQQGKRPRLVRVEVAASVFAAKSDIRLDLIVRADCGKRSCIESWDSQQAALPTPWPSRDR